LAVQRNVEGARPPLERYDAAASAPWRIIVMAGCRKAGRLGCAAVLLLGMHGLAHAQVEPAREARSEAPRDAQRAGPAEPRGLWDAAHDTLAPIVVEAPEPLFVAPTRWDRIGRIWVPVLINDKGPFRLVLDTGASHTAVNAGVAAALGIAVPVADAVTLRGATGSRTVPSIAVERIVVGDVDLGGRRLPIVSDALGGADGVMGAEDLLDKRIRIDFGRDRISVQRSVQESAPAGFVTIPVQIVDGLLVVGSALVGGIGVRLIFDTGGQGTLVNEALRRALGRELSAQDAQVSQVTGATSDRQLGDRMVLPEIVLGAVRISPAEVTVGDLYIFQYWRMTQTPAILLGMDVIGLLDTLIIDYRRRELQLKTR
jgi:predicted aspartyl protease